MKRVIFALSCSVVALAALPTVAVAERSAEADQIRGQLGDSTRSLERAVKAIGPTLRALATPGAGKVRAAIAAVRKAQAESTSAQAAFKRAASLLGRRAGPARAGLADLGALDTTLDRVLKDLEAADQMGNFEIQDLMSHFNQSEQLASKVSKAKEDTAMAIIGNLR